MLDLEGVDFIDSQGAAKLTEITQLMDVDSVALRLAASQTERSRGAPGRRNRREIGEDHIHGNVNRAIEAQLASG